MQPTWQQAPRPLVILLQTTGLMSALASGSGTRLQCQQETHRTSSNLRKCHVQISGTGMGVHSWCVVDEENLRPAKSRPSQDCTRLATGRK